MNKSKIKKILFALLFVFVTFFTLNVEVKAAYEVGAFLPYPGTRYDCVGSNKKYCYDLCKFNKNGTCASNLESNRQMRQIGIYYMYDSSKTINYEHAYCIEPGVTAVFPGSGDSKVTFTATPVKYNVSNLNKVQQILTFAPKMTSQEIKTLKDQFPSVGGWNNKNFKDLYYKVFAAQGLVWEVLEGQRTSFANCTQSNCAPQHNKVPGGVAGQTFYTMIKTNSDLSKIYKEYVRIVQDAYNAFEVSLKDSAGYEFIAAESSAKTYKLKWDSNLKKFALTIGYGSKLSYWEVGSKTSDELKVSLSDAVDITADKTISKDSPRVIELKVKNPHTNTSSDGAIAFQQASGSNKQDVIKVVGTTKAVYMKVYTPTYQLKVIKEDENGNRLKGVSFYLCESNSYKKCNSTNSIKTITTDSNGEATYDKLPNPGTYYVREVEPLDGYVEDNTVYTINVTANAESGTQNLPLVSIKNKKKEFTLTKTVWTDDGEVDLTSDDEWLEDEDTGDKTYIGPEFVILDSKNNGVKLTSDESVAGVYYYSGIADSSKNATRLRTDNGTFKVYGLPDCTYYVEEKKAPEGQTLPSNTKLTFNACSSNPKVTFVNGFTGLEFHKKNENGELLSGGEYTLQIKENNYYKDVLLTQTGEGIYSYSSTTNEDDGDATYIFETKDGKAFIQNLPAGEYRVIEKTAPDGYELIEDKDSTALVTISDANKDDNYIVEMVDRKTSASGGEASAELVLTITTGRTILNYALIIGGLVILLILAYILRKKIKK